MRGLVRPCRHDLDRVLHEQWRGHLCGLCLTLRDTAGQASRILTGYDVLLLSVLVEAQAGPLASATAGPCALRGFRTATVADSDTAAMRLAAAGSLLAGAAGLTDKIHDRDLPPVTRPLAGRAAGRYAAAGRRLAADLDLPTDAVLGAPHAAATIEADTNATLDDLLAPSGCAVSTLFAHTAVVADMPHNTEALRCAGDSFGRLVHLADAADDLAADRNAGRSNPLAATGTSTEQAREVATRLHATLRQALAGTELTAPALLNVLLGPVLDKARRRVFGPAKSCAPHAQLAVLTLGAGVASAGVFGGGQFGRRRRYYDPRDDPNYDPRYGRGYGRGNRRGPSCCDLLACDCCANMACNDCCGGNDDGCCVCCC
jgi:hypothetical protein